MQGKGQWEHVQGLNSLIFLANEGELPPRIKPMINRRIFKMRGITAGSKTTEGDKHLRTLVHLWLDFASGYMDKKIRYSEFVSVKQVLTSNYVRVLAEDARGEPYKAYTCLLGQDCPAVPEVWEQ